MDNKENRVPDTFNAVETRFSSRGIVDASMADRLLDVSKSIFDSISPNIDLMFFEFNPDSRQDYPVDFHMNDVCKFEQNRIVFSGVLKISANRPRKGYLVYNYANATFERGHITKTGNVIVDMPLEIDNTDPNNVDLIKRLLTHVTHFTMSKDIAKAEDINC